MTATETAGTGTAEGADTAVRVERLLAGPFQQAGYVLLDVQFRQEGRWVLRLTVDRESGVSLDHLGEMSELAGRLLDVEDLIPQSYSLEVSSPGLFRPLRERKHFLQSVGKLARITLAPGILEERKQRTLRGVITGVEEETVRISVAGQPEEETLHLPLDGIRSAKLDPDL